MAALVLALNQVKFCEIHYCRPSIEWGPFPSCKYAGVRYPGRTPFFEKARGPNAFEYYFRPLCENPPSQLAAPKLTCEQREQVHRVLPWAVRTYYYGRNDPQSSSPTNGSWAEFNEQWYRKQRTEGARLVSKYLRLQPSIEARLEQLSVSLLGRAGGPSRRPNGVTLPRSPTLGVHLRGTDKGKYIQTAGSGRQVLPSEYIPYVHAFLEAHPNGSVFVATDSPSFLSEVQERWPQSRVRYQREVLRMETNIAFSAGKHSNYRKGEEVLLDMLLLSRCDFLLHAASGVAEFAIYFNPKLHHNSVHLQYTLGRQEPSWAPTIKLRAESKLRKRRKKRHRKQSMDE